MLNFAPTLAFFFLNILSKRVCQRDKIDKRAIVTLRTLNGSKTADKSSVFAAAADEDVRRVNDMRKCRINTLTVTYFCAAKWLHVT